MFWRRKNKITAPAFGASCTICGTHHDFSLPDHLKEKLYDGQVILFAGAGISTENPTVFPYTLYDDVKGELGIPRDKKVSFSSVMGQFCALPDGRARLLQKIRERFDYISAFPELYRSATRFHKELSTLHHIQTIVTTNWDDYFELECGAIPFVTPEDFALWHVKGRKVFKIHGSINNYGSIVASDTDYSTCYDSLRDGILGATLKNLIGTRTVVYVGYSMGDSDFRQIQKFLQEEMKEVLPHSYLVTPFRDEAKAIESHGLTPIITDGQHFISTIKKHSVADGQMIDDACFQSISMIYELLLTAHAALHEKVNPKEHPYMVYCSCYQDGFMQALERAMSRVKTGEYSKPDAIPKWIASYQAIRADKVRIGKYHDVAYVDGYIAGLSFMLKGKNLKQNPSLFYVYGVEDQPTDLESFETQLKQLGILNKNLTIYAQKLVKKQTGNNPELEFHHTPFIF